MLYDNALLARVYLHAWQVDGRSALSSGARRDRHLRAARHVSSRQAASTPPRTPTQKVKRASSTCSPSTRPAASWATMACPKPRSRRSSIGMGSPRRGTSKGTTSCGVRSAVIWHDHPSSIGHGSILLTYRNERVRPGLDDKVLTEWNGLMLAALAEAAAATGDTAWRDAALRSAEFLTTQLRRADGRWLRSWQADIGAATPRLCRRLCGHDRRAGARVRAHRRSSLDPDPRNRRRDDRTVPRRRQRWSLHHRHRR